MPLPARLGIARGRKQMKIKLKCGRSFLIDKEDAEKLNNFGFHLDRRNRKRQEYITFVKKENGKWVKHRLHRFILGITDKNIEVDHINGNGLDNRKTNLRPCNRTENARNRVRAKINKSGYKGVFLNRGAIRAQITINYKNISLGSFGTLEEAAMAYNEAATRYFGEFAQLNKVQ